MMTRARWIVLFFEAVAFTILVPGTVLVWLPAAILHPAERTLPEAWTLAHLTAGILLAVGAAIYLRCLWEFGARGRGIPSPVDHPKELVVTGLYRYVRNPMYVGVFVMLVGEVVLYRSWGWLVFALGWFVFINVMIVFYEEPHLRRKFGDSYVRYTNAVGRWIPTL
jgi:protein-S-isoprenylcysteine O-methyltransferase Ste14